MIRLVENFSGLEAVRKKLQAPLSDWVIETDRLSERETLLAELKSGITRPLDDIEVDRGGLFSIEGEQVVIYIKDHTHVHTRSRQPKNVRENPEDGKRVHLHECTTIAEMKDRGRFDRYVATNRRDNIFDIDVMCDDQKTVEQISVPLRPCKNCFKELDYHGYTNLKRFEQKELWGAFDLVDFFECYSTFFPIRPKFTDKTAPTSVYVHDWSLISDRVRAQSNWSCEKCSVNLGEPRNRRWLHVHHKNGQKGDNHPSNLISLCVSCHKQEPDHHHMYVSPDGSKAISKARKNG